MANKRLFYAVYSAAFSKLGLNTYTAVHGLQSLGLNTKFNLEQAFEIGQISLYENIENIPDIEVTMQKVLDGYPLIYHLATNGSTSSTLSGRADTRCTLGISFFTDTQNSASGTPLAQCTLSGLYPSAVNFDLPNNGNFTESCTLVGNNKVWNNTFTAPTFNNTDSPLALSGSGGVNRREDFLLGEQAGVISLLPTDIPGVSASGTVPYSAGQFATHIISIKTGVNLGREQMFELGRRGPYFRYVQFPVEVKTDIEIYCLQGDNVTALEDATSNISDQRIYLACREGTRIDLGTKNKLSSVSFGGANAGQGGGNATDVYSYVNFNDFDIKHANDPSGL